MLKYFVYFQNNSLKIQDISKRLKPRIELITQIDYEINNQSNVNV